MTELSFRIEFAGPFQVSTGQARPGVDATVDLGDPLPATSLKGLMRASLHTLLSAFSDDAAKRLCDKVFGSTAITCPWAWTGAEPEQGTWCTPRRAARIRIDPDRHVAADDMFGVTEQTQTGAAVFRIVRTGHIAPEDLALHRAALSVSAEATRSLGGGRRRGLGWVHITSRDHRPSTDDIQLLFSQGES